MCDSFGIVLVLATGRKFPTSMALCVGISVYVPGPPCGSPTCGLSFRVLSHENTTPGFAVSQQNPISCLRAAQSVFNPGL